MYKRPGAPRVPGFFFCNHTEDVMGQQVLLYSGGMDSFIAAHAYPGARLLYIDTGARYAAKELAHLPKVTPKHRPVVIDKRLNLADVERDDLIVPARNLLLVTIATYYGNDIMLAATAGDKSTDKDQVFADKAAELLTHIYDSHHFKQGHDSPVTVRLPYKEASKGQMVAEYLRQEGDPQALADTMSCYHPTLHHCGVCKACIRKWVALKRHGIHALVPWATDPMSYKGWDEIVDKILNGGWRCKAEDEETLWALAH